MSDYNKVSLYGKFNETFDYGVIGFDEGEVGSDALKISACRNIAVTAHRVVGGKEDAIDINNHCEDVWVAAGEIVPKGDYAITVKGGSKGIIIHGVIVGHGKVVDVDIGNVADQSDNLTGPVKLCLWHDDGTDEPITVRCIGGPRPILMNEGEQKYELIFKIPGFFQSWFLKGYKLVKKLNIGI